jgi:hypothetical protein
MPNGVFKWPDKLGYMAKIIDGNVEITSKHFKGILTFCGIVIPYNLRSEYEGTDCIRLGDKYFDKAFVEIYYTQQLKKRGYEFIADKIDELTKEMNYLKIDKSKLLKD